MATTTHLYMILNLSLSPNIIIRPSSSYTNKANRPMKKTQLKQHRQEISDDDDKDKQLEILKAVAQAWLSHSSNKSRPIYNEHDAHRRNIGTKQPTRFKFEETKNKKSIMIITEDLGSSSGWDFNQSLWDPYEIVTVSKRLEDALVLDYEFSADVIYGAKRGSSKTSKESKNSLRSLFNKISSRRFDDSEISDIYR